MVLKLLEKQGETYALVPMSQEFLVSSSPVYQKAMFDLAEHFNRVMEQIEPLLQGQPPVMPETSPRDHSEYLKKMGQVSLNGSLQAAAHFITHLPEFPSFRQMADLGGSHGYYTMALLDRNERLQGTVYDIPGVAAVANDAIADMGYTGRMKAVGIDLRQGFPEDRSYDLVFTSHILYGWKGRLEEVFQSIHSMLRPGGMFVSNHMYLPEEATMSVPVAIVEFMTKLSGYPSHHLSEAELIKALEHSGFENFNANANPQARMLLLAARRAQ